jgi:hypothetical protein
MFSLVVGYLSRTPVHLNKCVYPSADPSGYTISIMACENMILQEKRKYFHMYPR